MVSYLKYDNKYAKVVQIPDKPCENLIVCLLIIILRDGFSKSSKLKVRVSYLCGLVVVDICEVADESESKDGFRIPNFPRKLFAATGLVLCCEVPATDSRTPMPQTPIRIDEGDLPDTALHI